MSAVPEILAEVAPRRVAPPAAAVDAAAPARADSIAERFYHPELDSIRVFLFFGVWSYHVLPRDAGVYAARQLPEALASLVSGGIKAAMCSLDVFFIVSAFLITELLLREREKRGAIDLKAFYARRLLRIWPLYFFMIALACVVGMLDSSQVVGPGYALAFLLFAGNWMMVAQGLPQSQVLTPLWSVSFEEQFYLLWPLVVSSATKKTICRVAIGMLAVAGGTRLVLLWNHVGGDPLWYNTFARLDSLALGVLLAVVLHGHTNLQLGRRARGALLLGGLTAWFIVGRYCGLLDATPSLLGGMIGYPLMSLGGAAIFLSVLGATRDGAFFLQNPALVYFGKISFGLYAFHLFGLRLTYYLSDFTFPFGWTLSLVCALVITFLLAAASFKWLESPFLRMKQDRFTHVPSGAAS